MRGGGSSLQSNAHVEEGLLFSKANALVIPANKSNANRNTGSFAKTQPSLKSGLAFQELLAKRLFGCPFYQDMSLPMLFVAHGQPRLPL